jgi:uncharacterized Fe-S cluster-containing MiaB family protein
MNISMILNATFRGKTEENSVKNHDEAYMAVWKPWNIHKEIYYLIIRGVVIICIQEKISACSMCGQYRLWITTPTSSKIFTHYLNDTMRRFEKRPLVGN